MTTRIPDSITRQVLSPSPTEFPVRVDRVHVDGVKCTRDDVIRAQLRTLFRVDNLADLAAELRLVRQRLVALNAFDHVSYLLDTNMLPDPEAPKKTIACQKFDVHFLVKEKERLHPFFRPHFPAINHLSFQSGIEINNLFGRGQSLFFSGCHSLWSRTGILSGEMGARLVIPYHSDPFTRFGLGAVVCRHPIGIPHRNAVALTADVRLPVRRSSVSHHELSAAIYLDVPNLLRPDRTEKQDCTLRLEHRFVRDTRLHLDFWPVDGSLVLLSHTLQVIGPTTSQLSGSAHELTIRFHSKLFDRFPRLTVTSSFFFGLLLSVSNSLAPSAHFCPTDRLLPIDGPGGVRGFRDGSIQGPVRAGAAFHLHWPLPLIKGWLKSALRFHLFATFGHADNVLSSSLSGMGSRCSVGFGIAGNMNGMCQAELNYCIPIRTHEQDNVIPGIQFGIGAEFL